jgi:arsenical pump membrane protein
VLPISNQANLVLFDGSSMPSLLEWLERFALPSIAVTYVALRWCLRHELGAAFGTSRPLPRGAGVALAGIIGTALALLGPRLQISISAFPGRSQAA